MIDWPLERDLARAHEAAQRTRERIARFVRHTPLLELSGHPRRALKLETLQHTGSFKVRGAAAAITAAPRPRQIVAASTGNHGLAVAAVAHALELPCRVFVPAGAAPAKLARLRAGAAVPKPQTPQLQRRLRRRTGAGWDVSGLPSLMPF